MNKLEKFRKKNKLSCEKMASLVGVSKASVSRHCRGLPIDIGSAVKYRASLGMALDDLIPRAPELGPVNNRIPPETPPCS